MGMGHGAPDQQGHHYASMYLPDHMTTPMTMHSPVSYGGSPPTYTTLSSPHSASQSPMGNSHMMHHPQNTRPQQSMMGPSAPPGRSPTNSNSSPANPETTTSDDSDDSVPVSQMTPALKRPSPEPVDSRSMSAAAAAVKKPKAQKKKKKRDPNEPQKPVSAYALFFRDTQAAIKGQNPNASFGEVSKIVASMWDALDAEHKNVYKKKTEAAKKEYLKALAAYRASLVSKTHVAHSP
ncbi:unnamed protein product [Allacma fusca]|uniref:HMG box domain-containing protein n=1 Tax=Allacma fusca TaxID=39272 RepID=A0A8J2JXJ3_9HEXA|nr:unnamed protein product [Allacma fusca]